MSDLQSIVPSASWSSLSALIALALAFYGGWSLWRHRKPQDAFVVLLGLYLAALELPLAIPALGMALGATCPLSGDFASKVTRIAPAAALFALASVDWKWSPGRPGQKEG